MIDANDLYEIPAFNEEHLRSVFESAYNRLFHGLSGDGVLPASFIIDSINEEVNSRLHSMVTDAIAELEW